MLVLVVMLRSHICLPALPWGAKGITQQFISALITGPNLFPNLVVALDWCSNLIILVHLGLLNLYDSCNVIVRPVSFYLGISMLARPMDND